MFDHVYAGAHEQLDQERDAFLAYLDTFAD